MQLEQLISTIYRQEAGRMTSALLAYFGLEEHALAEDLVQETFLAALQEWQKKGVPEKPLPWLYKVCKNKTANLIKQKQRWKQHEEPLALAEEVNKFQQLEELFLEHEIRDSQLRMLFACCHPHFSPKAQLVLTLKAVSGLRTEEIGRCLGMQAEAVEKMLQRSRQSIRQQGLSFAPPFAEQAQQRLEMVQLVLYLMFTEGYSASSGEGQIKKELCLEATRLVRLLLDVPFLPKGNTQALLALMLLHTARFEARINMAGEILELELQDRGRWDQELIQLGIHYLNKAARSTPAKNRYLLEAAIAAEHCRAHTFAATNWVLIHCLYQEIAKLHPSIFVQLNSSIAVLYAAGPAAALPQLQELEKHAYLKGHHLLHLSLAKAWVLLGNTTAAAAYYRKALESTRLAAERDFIQKKLAEINSLEKIQ